MIQGISLLVSGVALYAVAGSVLSGRLARCANGCSRRRLARMLPFALAGVCALGDAGFGAYLLYRDLGVERMHLPLPVLGAIGVAAIGLLAGVLLVLAAIPRRRGGGGGGGRDDDLPPAPDPNGPDGWAEFERQFRAFVVARDEARVRVLVG